jgi:hypothetical protein
MKDNWSKYKARIESARRRIPDARNQIIHLRSTVGEMMVDKAIKLTDNERDQIEWQMKIKLVTKDDWRRAGYPIVPKLDDVPYWKNWKSLINEYKDEDK